MWEITVFVITLELGIGIIDGIGLFDTMMYNQTGYIQQQGATAYNITTTGNLITASTPTSMDYYTMGVGLVMAGWNVLVSVFIAVVCILPMLILKFHVPPVLAIPLQAMIYLMYVWGIAQWKSGRSGGMLQ
jgi:uncharacterized membrane protein